MDQRGPWVRELAASGAERRYWRSGEWWFECARYEGQWWAVRQIGPSRYSCEHLEDEHGFLTDQPLDDDTPGERVDAQAFERAWSTLK